MRLHVDQPPACARSSNDPGPRRPRPSPTKLRTASESATARRCPARSRALEVADQAATGSTAPGGRRAGPSPARRTPGTAPRRTGRSRPRRGWRSAACRTDGPARPADRWPPPTSELARSSVCPSPWTAVYGSAPRWRRSLNFHHGLLTCRRTRARALAVLGPAPCLTRDPIERPCAVAGRDSRQARTHAHTATRGLRSAHAVAPTTRPRRRYPIGRHRHHERGSSALSRARSSTLTSTNRRALSGSLSGTFRRRSVSRISATDAPSTWWSRNASTGRVCSPPW